MVYLATICPTVYSGDSGELTAAAFHLGIPHNSGYPLYALLGKLFCLIPLGNIGFRMNCMSACFAALTVWLTYFFIYRITSSAISSIVGSSVLAFSPLLWQQTISSEVYSLHAFFVTLLLNLLWWWDGERELSKLAVFVFITGLSFGNHLQTLMLGPPVLYFIMSGDRKVLFQFRSFFILVLLFLVALSLYVYLPIRTNAGAALHWGDPNTLERFLAHITARSHRAIYVLNRTPFEYLSRVWEMLSILLMQYGGILLFAIWGWMRLPSGRYRLFFVGIVLFDFFYAVFLNIISFEITAFGIPSFVVFSILAGIGVSHLLILTKESPAIGRVTQRIIKLGFCMAPAILLAFNFGMCDQSRNYTAYEHTVNIFRSLGSSSTLFIDGDNNVFPVLYGHLVERMGKGISLYDRYSLIFKWPLSGFEDDLSRSQGDVRSQVAERIIAENITRGVFFAGFDPAAITIPGRFSLQPYGIIQRVVGAEPNMSREEAVGVWRYYSTESFYDDFQRDYMTRQICAYFHFGVAKSHFLLGDSEKALHSIKLASEIGYDDEMIHSDMAVFLTDRGFFAEARMELEKALIYFEDLSAVHNNWGYYFNAVGDHERAVTSLRKAIKLSPGRHIYLNNLGLALLELGRRDDAVAALRRSLSISSNQPVIENLLKQLNTQPDPGRKKS